MMIRTLFCSRTTLCSRLKFYPTDSVEATGGASVDAACVMKAGPMKTAAAPWKPILVWQTIRCCVTVEGFATAEHVNVTHHMQARPVRSALFVRERVRNKKS